MQGVLVGCSGLDTRGDPGLHPKTDEETDKYDKSDMNGRSGLGPQTTLEGSVQPWRLTQKCRSLTLAWSMLPNAPSILVGDVSVRHCMLCAQAAR